MESGSESVQNSSSPQPTDSQSKGLKCSVCKIDFPSSEFSSKQLKAKGKRKCKKCAEVKAAEPPKSSKEEKEGKAAVKSLRAAEVAKAQSKDNELKSVQDDKYNTFLKWLKEYGAKFPHLYLKYYAVDYRGVHALHRLANDQLILEVPLKLIMTSEVAKESDIGQKIITRGVQLRSTHSYLASYLCQEKHNPTSFWKPYIDTLPVHYRNMPIFFDQDELKYLEGSFSLQMIEDRKESLKAEYDGICQLVPEFSRYTLQEFIWARLAVITRIFGLKVNGKKTDGLVPMADMLNHKIPKETSWTYDQERGGFTITTSKRLLKGAQIFDSYGRKCNSRFFVNYGFSLEENEDNQVAMYFDLPPNDAEHDHQIKVQFLGKHQRRFQIPADHKEKVTLQCFSYLRLAHASGKELMYLSLLLATGGNVKKIEPVSPQNEFAVLQEIARQAKKVLAGFPQSLEQDNKLLEDPEGKLTMNVRNAILMRRGEKQVLHYYIDLAKEMEPYVEMKFKQFKGVVARLYSGGSNGAGRFDPYINDIWLPMVKANEGDKDAILLQKLKELKEKNAPGAPRPPPRLDDAPSDSDSD